MQFLIRLPENYSNEAQLDLAEARAEHHTYWAAFWSVVVCILVPGAVLLLWRLTVGNSLLKPALSRTSGGTASGSFNKKADKSCICDGALDTVVVTLQTDGSAFLGCVPAAGRVRE